MIAELGHFALVLALVCAFLQAAIPLLGVWRGDRRMQAVAGSAAYAQLACLLLAFLALEHAFLHNDFTLDYVARNSNTLLPVWYKMSAVWGGHEGSLLLWALVLGFWSAAVATFSRGLPRDMVARVLAVMGLVAVAFHLFILLTSNPFARALPDFPMDGNDLNPLLQDPGLIFHPPILYTGYVGFSVPFAFAIAGLLSGRLDSAWARWSRPWTVAAWCFLSLGIALGSFWAYYELGWGGWWFWDPVENASFMPWLAGTALIHSLAVTEKRGVFKAWTVMLAIIAFSLSLLGTFLVRSGVLTSVHAFAADPSRGEFVLGILLAVIGGSLLLFAIKGSQLGSESHYQVVSREMFLLANNILLVTATSVVFLGTLFPLIADAFHLAKISVGPPYFNLLFIPLTWILLFFLGIGPLANWKRHDPAGLVRALRWVLPVAVALGVGLPWVYFGEFSARVAISIVLTCWVLISLLRDIYLKAASARAGMAAGLLRLSRSYVGMQLAHVGLIITIIGIAITSTYSVERDVRLNPGQKVAIGPFSFVFKGVKDGQGPNYLTQRGEVDVYEGGQLYKALYPEKRTYFAQRNVMTETAISGGLLHDIYVALGEPLEQGAWAVRVYYKPFVRWLWLGAIFMALGGTVAASDRRYRLSRKVVPGAASVVGETA